MTCGEIEAVKSRGQSMAKLVVGEWGTDVREEDVGGGRGVKGARAWTARSVGARIKS